jgi:hypothetical protein
MIVHAADREGVCGCGRRSMDIQTMKGAAELRPVALVFSADSAMFDEGAGLQFGHGLS